MPKPKLLILTGPQGAGNHLFAKLFNLHTEVTGWKMSQKEWQGHHLEPFNDYWQNPALLKNFKWNKKYYVTSISCPYYRGKKPKIPKYQEFILHAKKYANIIIGIIGRDCNILKLQQKRVRGKQTYSVALKQFKKFYLYSKNIHFISTELFYLYGQNYLKILRFQMGFPIAYKSIKNYLKEDSNKKYIITASKGPYDQAVKKACEES